MQNPLSILKNKFAKWVRDPRSSKNEIPKSVALNKESITAVDLQVFDDASIQQPSVTNQGLVVSKLLVVCL